MIMAIGGLCVKSEGAHAKANGTLLNWEYSTKFQLVNGLEIANPSGPKVIPGLFQPPCLLYLIWYVWTHVPSPFDRRLIRTWNRVRLLNQALYVFQGFVGSASSSVNTLKTWALSLWISLRDI
jgi:hypothetical protein